MSTKSLQKFLLVICKLILINITLINFRNFTPKRKFSSLVKLIISFLYYYIYIITKDILFWTHEKISLFKINFINPSSP